VDEKAVATVVGEALGRADADFVRDVTGFAIGGVAPLGAPRPLRTFMDRDLLAFPFVWAAAGTPFHVFETVPDALRIACDADVIAVR
jgi:prolyl-tRNA editing enzyme YbaK/EbsC (Cys-tRNA(Pro) deacylase)